MALTALKMRNLLAHERTLPILILIFAASRLIIIPLVPLTPQFDCQWYFDRAVGIAHGAGYSVNGVATAYYPVGYPALLGLLFFTFGTHVWVGALANVAFGVGICILIHRLSLEMFGDRAAAGLAVAIFVFYPNQAGYIPAITTEVLYQLLILLALYIYARRSERWPSILAFGLILGFATLVKSQTMMFPVFMAALPFRSDAGWGRITAYMRRLVIIYVGVAAVVVPWSARNYLVFGEIVPVSTNDGVSLLNGNNPYANGDVSPNEGFLPLAGEQLGDTPAFEIAADHRQKALALAWIKSDPLKAMELWPLKIWRQWAVDGETELAYITGFAQFDRYVAIFTTLHWINRIYYVLMIAGCAGGLVALWRQRVPLTTAVLAGPAMAIFTTLLAMAFSGQSRYHHYLMPWVGIYAAWFIVGYLPSRKARQAGDTGLSRVQVT
jgi:4-amino-4-deoxy-L-arabinose transferase-like glycosyltransferase